MPQKIPLLLLPGLLCDEALWRNQIDALKNIADSHVADLTRHDSMEALAKDALTSAPPQFALAGMSMGGYVAFEIMRQAPGRVLKLCLLDTSARPDTSEQQQRRRLLMSMAKAGEFRGVTPRLLPVLIHSARMDDKELVGTITSMAERVGREAFQNQQTAILNRIDSLPYLKDIRCPVQVIGGREDALTPPEITREIADGISGARFDVIDNCGHLSPLERPEEVAVLMKKWLEVLKNPPILLARKRVVIPLIILYAVMALQYFPNLHNWVDVNEDRPFGADFTNLWFAARLTLDGQIHTLFDNVGFWNAQSNFFGQKIEFHNWSYPPHILPWILWLGWMPYFVAYGVWMLLTFGAYAAAVVIRRPSPWLLTLVLALAPSSIINLGSGQTGFLAAALLIGGLRLLDEWPVFAGVLFGFLTVKPQLGLLLPVALLAGRRWRAILAAVLTTAVLIGLSVFLFGIAPWQVYLQNTVVLQREILEAVPEKIYSNMMTSPFMAARILGAPVMAAYGIAVVVAVGAAVVVATAFARLLPPDLRNVMLLTGTFLCSPYMFSYDMPTIGAAVLMMFLMAGRQLQPDHRTLLCAAWLLPLLVLRLNLVALPVTPLVCAGVLWVQWQWAKQPARYVEHLMV